MTGRSTFWEDTDGCAKQYRYTLDICLMNVLSSSYGIIMDSAINSLDHGKNAVYGINATKEKKLKGKMELIGKLGSNYAKNIGMLPSYSKDVSIQFLYQCLHIINNK